MSINPHAATDRIFIAAAFAEAVALREFDRAEALWPEMSGPLSDNVYLAAVDLFAERERWSEATEALSLVRNRPGDFEFRRNLFRNFAALKQHRPAVYRVVATVDTGNSYQLVDTPSGLTTIAVVTGGRLTRLCPGADPRAALRQVVDGCADALASGTAVALAGVGDGYVLSGLAEQDAPLALGRQQPLFVFEPDARLLFACLLLHDFTGPRGPIEQKRVRWYVGPNWAVDYRVDALTDRYLPFPTRTVRLNADTREIDDALAAVLQELSAVDAAAGDDLAIYYASSSAQMLADAIAGRLDRSPRVTLLTTRFSTVLQYSTRDMAAAFHQLGWETQTLIEPSPWHALHKVGMRRSVADFKPDMVVQIDHHRFEHGDLFPPALPFVNWVQDLLPHLMSASVGNRLGGRDFSLVPSAPRWSTHFAYPERQCMEFRKLARIPARPATWRSEAGLIVYVSNWSQTPDRAAADMVRNATGVAQDIVRVCCDRLVALYAAGGACATGGDVRRVVEKVCPELGVQLGRDATRRLVSVLYDKINNTLYRQQGLAWAAETAEREGLTLAIYGTGWEAHPDFARYARGAVTYGQPLEALTRSAAVNLVLEPYVCVAHQRLLDALAAGGCCLTRDHPNNHLIQETIDLLSKVNFDAGAATSVGLSVRLNAGDRLKLATLLRRVAETDTSPDEIDTVAIVHAFAAAGVVAAHEPLLPGLAETTFACRESMATALVEFAALPQRRDDLAALQRRVVERRFSYEAGMKRVAAFVERRLREETPARMAAAA